MARPRIGIFVVAYNAVTTLARTLDRIPAELRELVDEIFVFDDASTDDTWLLAKGYQQVSGWKNLTVFRNPQNKGYGGNQKLGYRYASGRGLDFVVLLHGDGQYAPEAMPRMLAPLLEGRADAVFGSRMMERGAARKGGMPLYKFVGNRILSTTQNALAGVTLTEWHSGYRAYRVKALDQLPLERNTDDFHFDTEIILELLDRGMRIVEVPIPTYYGDEICRVNGMRYAKDVFKTALQHKLHVAGMRSDPRFVEGRRYRRKAGPHSSHSVIASRIPFGSRVLDVGCEPEIARAYVERRCEVVGVGERSPSDLMGLAAYHSRDLERPLDLPRDEKPYDVIVLGDVIEHLRRGPELLAELKAHLKPGGHLIVSTGNVAFATVRLSLLFGRFRYSPRGILDETHVRLYTKRTLLETIRDAGFEPTWTRGVPPPLEAVAPRAAASWPGRAASAAAALLARAWSGPFAFQLVAEARPRREEERAPQVLRPGESPEKSPEPPQPPAIAR